MRITEDMRKLALDVMTELDLTPPFTAWDLIAAASAEWSMPIVLHPFRIGSRAYRTGTTGWCRYKGTVFHIYYYAGGSTLQQERILYHEMGHVLCNHVAPYSRQVRKGPGVDHNLEEVTVEAFAEAMMELAIFGAARDAPSRMVSPSHLDPYTRFLIAQE